MTGLIAALAGGIALGAVIARLRARRRRRELETELDDARRRLARAVEARETFFALATHELRSPLSVIFGYRELLRDGAYGPISEEAADALDRMGHAARHLLHLIDGIIELGRLESGSVRLELDTVDVGAIITATAETFRAQAEDRGLNPRVEVPSTTPRIRTDRERMLRAIDLTLTSAIRHPAADTITLEAVVDDGTVTLRIGPTDLDLGSELPDAAGMGIRLRAAARIAELLDGSLDLRVEEGRAREITLVFRGQDAAAGL